MTGSTLSGLQVVTDLAAAEVDSASSGGEPEQGVTASSTSSPRPTPLARSTRWRVDLQNDRPTAPAVGRFVAVGVDTEVRAYEPTTGVLVWSSSFERRVESLATDGTTLVAVVRERGLGGPTTVVALDFRTGNHRWAMQFTGRVRVLAIGDGHMFLSTYDDIANNTEVIGSFDIKNGTERWTQELPEPYNMVIDEGTLVVASIDGIRNLTVTSGTVRWFHSLDYELATLVVGSGTVAAIEEVDTGETAINVLDRRGTLRWTFDRWLATGLTLHNGHLYAGGKHIAAFNLDEPEPRWRVDRSGYLNYAPVVDGAILAGSDGIRAYELDSGTLRWAFTPEETSPLPAGVRDETIYGRTTHVDDYRDVFGVDATDGTERWHFTAEDRLSEVIIGRQGGYVTSNAGMLYALS